MLPPLPRTPWRQTLPHLCRRESGHPARGCGFVTKTQLASVANLASRVRARSALPPVSRVREISCGLGSGYFGQSLPLELPRTADVSPSAVTFRGRKLLISIAEGQNRAQEADGSIPFGSNKRRARPP